VGPSLNCLSCLLFARLEYSGIFGGIKFESSHSPLCYSTTKHGLFCIQAAIESATLI
jgi:hypothetical protein